MRKLIASASLLAGLLLCSQAVATVPDGIRADALLDSENALLREPLSDREQLRPGDEFTLGLRITPFKNNDFEFHIYGDQQGDEGTPTVFAMDPVEGVTWSDPVFPEAEVKEDIIGTTYLIKGQQYILIKGKLADDFQPGPIKLTGKLEYMTCTDDICLAPSRSLLEWNLTVVPADFAGDIAVKSEAELTAPVETDWSVFSLPTSAAAAPTPETPGPDGEAGKPNMMPGNPLIDWGNVHPQTSSGTEAMSIWKILGLALLGGLILNFMPCVLPVVSIKVISLARHAEHEPATLVKQGLVFCLGIMATFLALAAAVALIQAGGTKLGWGFQFQNPTFLVVMAAVIFAFGLSMAGVFTIKPPKALTEAGEHLAEKEGYAGSFFKGVLATVLGTPCVGPFLGPALGYAFSQSAGAVFLIFGAVGVGMAIPYAAMVANPKFLHMGQRDRGRLTRSIMDSKTWLVDFERIMAFVLFATVLYLLYILQGSLGANGLFWTMVFLLAVAFALWLWGRLVTMGKKAIAAGIILLPLIIGISAYSFIANRAFNPPTAMNTGSTLPWKPYSEEALKQAMDEGKTVLVDFTAEWCPNCKYNERTALNVQGTKKVVEDLDVVCLKADWTARDEEITTGLNGLGYSSIPLSAVFPGKVPLSPIVLDGVFTQHRIQDELRKAAAMQEVASGGGSPVSMKRHPAVSLAGFRPDALEESEYAVLRDAYADRAQLRPGDSFTLALRLTPFKCDDYEFHIYGHEQGDQGFPTTLIMGETAGVTFSEPKYPKAEKHEDEVGVGYYLKGQQVILVQGKLSKKAQPGKLAISAKLQYMSCTDDLCLSPSESALSWELEVLPADNKDKIEVLSVEDLLKPVKTDWSRIVLPEHDMAPGEDA